MALAARPSAVQLRVLLGAGVFALAVAVFLPIRHHAWLNYDDPVYVTQSAPVVAGWNAASVRWAFTSFDGANWFPLTRLSWMADAELHGLSAGAFLTTNLVLHALASLVLFLALARLTGSAARSAFVAAVFAVHPLHVESVAWVAARKDSLAGLFFALTLLLYAGGPARGARRGAVLVCTALGLMAKPVLVTLPCVLLLLDYWPLRRLARADAAGTDPAKLRKAVLEKWPLFGLVAAASVVTVLAQRSGGAVASLDQVAFTARVANALHSTVVYLARSFWPTDLAVFYPHAGGDLTPAAVAGSAALLLGVSAVAWRERSRRPYLAVGWLWYLGMLVPVIGLVQVGSQAMADRYTYLPLIGIALAVCWTVADACSGLSARRVALPALALALIGALALATAAQLRHWRDSEALFRHALAVTHDNHVAHAYLGTALLARGDTAGAIESYRAALRIRPDLLTVSNNLAWLLATGSDPRHRDPIAAVALAERAARLTARADPAVLDTLAAAYAAAGRFGEARETLERAMAEARARSDDALAAELAGRLELYRADRPYVEPAP